MIAGMTYNDVVKHFGSAAEAARRIGVKPASVSEWRTSGISLLRQLHIEKITGGRLRAAMSAR